MERVLSSAVNVATPTALVAFIAGLLCLAYIRWLKKEEKWIAKLPPGDRAKATDKYLTRYGINASDLTKDKRFDLIKDEMSRRHGLYRFRAALATIVIIVGLIIAAVTYYISLNKPPHSEKGTSDQDKSAQEAIDPNAPLVRLDNLTGTALRHAGGTTYVSGGAFVVSAPQPHEPERAYPALTFDLASLVKHDVIKVTAVKVKIEPIERDVMRIIETSVLQLQPPVTYSAKLSRKKSSVAAALKLDGQLTDGLIIFSEQAPVAKFRLDFEGEPGLYMVKVAIEVQEARGARKQSLETSEAIMIHVASPEN